jgi:hypothetical protein
MIFDSSIALMTAQASHSILRQREKRAEERRKSEHGHGHRHDILILATSWQIFLLGIKNFAQSRET